MSKEHVDSRRLSSVQRQRRPDGRTTNSSDDMVVAGRPQMVISCTVFVLHSLRKIQPVQLIVQKTGETSPCVNDNANSGI